MAQHLPVRHQIADPVDRLVLGYPILRPLGIKGLLAAATTRRRDRNEIGAKAPRVGDLVGDAVVVKSEVTRRLGVSRVASFTSPEISSTETRGYSFNTRSASLLPSISGIDTSEISTSTVSSPQIRSASDGRGAASTFTFCGPSMAPISLRI